MSALPIALAPPTPSSSSSAQFFALRLEPGADVYYSLVAFAEQNNLRAAYIATAVGSVTEVTIRFANQPAGSLVGPGHFEVVSLVGTVAISGSHVHISVSDSLGVTTGGHLLPGSKVHSAGCFSLCHLVLK
jgi:predicted DNA-binding protein with PD1-like motif